MKANNNEKEFSRWLLDISDGDIEKLEVNSALQCDDLVNEIHFNMEKKSLLSRTILAPQNVEANKMNNLIVDSLPGVRHECYSIDRATLPGVDKLEKAEEKGNIQLNIFNYSIWFTTTQIKIETWMYSSANL